MDVIVNGSVRYQKNWLRKDRRIHERAPKTHIRNVRTGSDGSSVIGTVRATCLIGEFSSGSCSSLTSDIELGSIACDEDATGSSFSSLDTKPNKQKSSISITKELEYSI